MQIVTQYGTMWARNAENLDQIPSHRKGGRGPSAKAASDSASAKAECFRLDIAKANERAAEANEQEHLARVQLEARIAPRGLPAEEQADITSELTQLI
jgi:hypothetical protein